MEELQAIFQEALKKNKVITASSIILKSDKKVEIIDNKQVLVNNYTYYIKSLDSKAVNLRNPQCKDHLSISWDTIVEYFEKYTIL